MTTGPDDSPKPEPQSEAAAHISRRLVLDLATGYLAVLARIGSWVIVTAVAYRHLAERYFAALVAVRSTLTVLGYIASGLGTATIYAIAQARSKATPAEVIGPEFAERKAEPQATVLEYQPLQQRPTPVPRSEQKAFAGSFTTAAVTAGIIAFLASVASRYVELFFNTTTRTGSPRCLYEDYQGLFWGFAAAAAARILAEPSAAVLQASKLIFLDNALIVISEAVFCVLAVRCLVVGTALSSSGCSLAPQVAYSAVAAAVVLFLCRGAAVWLMVRDFAGQIVSTQWLFIGPLIHFAGLLTLAYLADYLYAPTDYLLINHLLPAAAAVAYTPAVQIDSGLLLLVSAVAAVLLPRAAAAYGQRQIPHVRRIYLLGTILCGAAMALAAAIVLLLARPLLTVWYGHDMPATRAILPLILISTVVGGSSAAGRAVLLGAGRTRAFTSAALLAGVANVILSFCFVRFMHLGLAGIVLGTVVVVVARCGIWMPWYVLRTLKHPTPGPRPEDAPLVEMPVSAP
jgi:O-antigen/teichoic acid export membrane protein